MTATASFKKLPKVAVLIPEEMRSRIFPQKALDALSSFAEPVIPSDEQLHSDDLVPLLEDVPAVITGWKSPKIPTEALAPNGYVKFISHTAGSVQPLCVLDALHSGDVRVSHAAPVIAHAVAEFTIAKILAHLRRHREIESGIRDGKPWHSIREDHLGNLLSAQNVGIVGMGHVGRLVLELLRPFRCAVYVYDPFLTTAQADELGVILCNLKDVFGKCSVISLHAENLPTTQGMITKGHLSLLQDGGLLVNTAQSELIESGAMFEALREGRIFAVIDAFDCEPLPENDALRQLHNVYLSPDCAAHTKESYVQQGLSSVEDVRLYLSGRKLNQEIMQETATVLA